MFKKDGKLNDASTKISVVSVTLFLGLCAMSAEKFQLSAANGTLYRTASELPMHGPLATWP